MSARSIVIVCERRGIWSAGFRRHLNGKLRVCETRTLADCREELAAAPASLLAVELQRDNLPGVLGLLVELRRAFPLARAVAVAERGLEPFEWLLREAGAIHFTSSPRESDVLARLAARHVAQVPVPRTTLANQIWESLPWREMAVS